MENKVAIITGASGGIGRSVASAMASRGASVALLSRNQNRLESLAGEIRSRYKRECLVLTADVRNSSQIQGAIERAMERWGRIDYLVNAAGIIHYRPFLDLNPEELDAMMSVNYGGTMACIRAVLPSMISQKSGHIVNIASTAGRRGFPMETGYSASKFAVVGFSEALRMDLHGTGVGVSVICPGIVDTPMSSGFLSIPGIRKLTRPLSADYVAAWVVKAILNKRAEVVTPLSTRFVILLSGVAPRLADGIIRRRVMRITNQIAKSSARA